MRRHYGIDFEASQNRSVSNLRWRDDALKRQSHSACVLSLSLFLPIHPQPAGCCLLELRLLARLEVGERGALGEERGAPRERRAASSSDTDTAQEEGEGGGGGGGRSQVDEMTSAQVTTADFFFRKKNFSRNRRRRTKQRSFLFSQRQEEGHRGDTVVCEKKGKERPTTVHTSSLREERERNSPIPGKIR